MDLNLIKRLIKIVDESSVTDLEIEENGFKIKVAKKVRSSHPVSAPHFVAHQPVTTEAKISEVKPDSAKPEPQAEKQNYHEIRSPIVGTFYRSPSPDADNYVKVGDSVTAGTILCIIEAMKLMNEIESDVNGKIIKVLVENGKPVEYNQPLFLIETV